MVCMETIEKRNINSYKQEIILIFLCAARKWRKLGDFTSERKITEVLTRERIDFRLESIRESYFYFIFMQCKVYPWYHTEANGTRRVGTERVLDKKIY